MKWLFLLISTYAFGQAPRFIIEPKDLKLMDGEALLLVTSSIGADGYQWWRDDAVLVGATNSFLAEDIALDGDAGRYWVVAYNQWGSRTSRVAAVTFNPYVKFFAGNRQVRNRCPLVKGLTIRMLPSASLKKILYTLDGSEPTLKSSIYATPIKIEKPCLIRVMVDGVEYLPLRIEAPL